MLRDNISLDLLRNSCWQEPIIRTFIKISTSANGRFIFYMKYILTIAIAFFCCTIIRAQKMPVVQSPVFKKDSFYITKYGAKADGIILNTKSINDAIDACNKKGGGIVVVPAGLWLTGPIVIKTGVNLHLQKGSLLLFTTDFNQYPLVKGNWEGIPQMRAQSPLSANDATNIAITGTGIIDGNGDAWRMVKKRQAQRNPMEKIGGFWGHIKR